MLQAALREFERREQDLVDDEPLCIALEPGQSTYQLYVKSKSPNFAILHSESPDLEIKVIR